MTMTNPKPEESNDLRRGMEAFAGIEAAPLNMPDMLNVVPVSPEIEFRWGNRVASDGLRFQQLVYSGFQPAEPKDVKGCPQMLIRDGKVIYGDLILMKISKRKYRGALLHNHNVSVRQMQKFTTANREGQKLSRQEILDASIGGPPELRSKLRAFTPSDKETEGMISEQQKQDAANANK